MTSNDEGNQGESASVKDKGKGNGKGGGAKKKGANPIKARLKAGSGPDTPAATHTAGSGPGISWLTIPKASAEPALSDPGCSRQCSQAAANQPIVIAGDRPFEAVLEPPLLTLLFSRPLDLSCLTAEQVQHGTMARPETYYEAPADKHGNTYLSWGEIERRNIKLCRGYGAFNLPFSSLRAWVNSMWEKEEASAAHEALPSLADGGADPTSRANGTDAEELSAAAGALSVRSSPPKEVGSDEADAKTVAGAVAPATATALPCSHGADSGPTPRWYDTCCNRAEASLLRYLEYIGALNLAPQAMPSLLKSPEQQQANAATSTEQVGLGIPQEAVTSMKQGGNLLPSPESPADDPRSQLRPTPGKGPVRYIISAVAPSSRRPNEPSALPHERLHALFFLSPSYRRTIHYTWGDAPATEDGAGAEVPSFQPALPAWLPLSAKTRKVIGADLNLRGYAEHVWADEFQAYLLGEGRKGPREPRGEGLWGSRVLEELRPIREYLEKEVLPGEVDAHLNRVDIWR